MQLGMIGLGRMIGSWLLDLTAKALFENPDLSKFGGHEEKKSGS
jgi:6-phosphogluconate dehydrogenase (decarboxylating)